MNALNAQVQNEIAEAASRLATDHQVRAVVLYGGEKVFAAGADIKEMADASYAEMAVNTQRLQNASPRWPDPASRWWRRSPVTRSAAAWNWRCAPTSGSPARAPRLASRRSSSGSSPARGHPAAAPAGRPGQGQGHRLHRPVRGRRRRRWPSAWWTGWCRTLRCYDAARALASRFASGPALALRAAKQAIDDGLDVDLDTGLEIERLQFAGLFATEDQSTGMHSFVENGPGKATFTGQ